MAVTVKTEISGVIELVLRAKGDKLDMDDEVILISAMKMQIPVMSPVAGRLMDILVAPGDVVSAGQALFVVEK